MTNFGGFSRWRERERETANLWLVGGVNYSKLAYAGMFGVWDEAFIVYFDHWKGNLPGGILSSSIPVPYGHMAMAPPVQTTQISVL